MSLITFYRNDTPDHAGRRLDDILAFSMDELEHHHDFIQWLFPLDTPSPVNPDAPTLDPATIRAFQADPQLQQNLRRALNVMLAFYGLQQTVHAITPGPTFPTRSQNWLRPMNHNHLRLTRILRSLHLLGLEPEARALQSCLLQLATESPHAITTRTRTFWQSAAPTPP